MAFNVLIVDDSATVRDIIAKTLRMAGLRIGDVHHAANGREALTILAGQWIDIVFADVNMPVMNGVEMVEQMAKDGLLATIPVVIVSSDGSATRVEQLKAKGVSAYVHKPFTPELLRSVVCDVLECTEEVASGPESD
jgi:two-component system, chemotaxis family, chemotaxis protein CheY